MNDKRPSDLDLLEAAWRSIRTAEPPVALYQELHRRIRETPPKPRQSSFGWALPATAAVLGVLAIAALAYRWPDNLAGPGAVPPTSSASASATPASPTSPAASATATPAMPTPAVTAGPGGSLSPPVAGKVWTKDGQVVPWYVLSLDGGPQHCGWETILFLRMSTRLGERIESAEQLMEYVRDPLNTWATASANPDAHRTLGRFEPSVPKPADAVFSGYVSPDGMELWRSDLAGKDAVFLRRGDTWERWPRSAEPIACA